MFCHSLLGQENVITVLTNIEGYSASADTAFQFVFLQKDKYCAVDSQCIEPIQFCNKSTLKMFGTCDFVVSLPILVARPCIHLGFYSSGSGLPVLG